MIGLYIYIWNEKWFCEILSKYRICLVCIYEMYTYKTRKLIREIVKTSLLIGKKMIKHLSGISDSLKSDKEMCPMNVFLQN